MSSEPEPIMSWCGATTWLPGHHCNRGRVLHQVRQQDWGCDAEMRGMRTELVSMHQRPCDNWPECECACTLAAMPVGCWSECPEDANGAHPFTRVEWVLVRR